MTENCKLRKAILSAFYNISQRNFGILLILWCSFKLWWNFCLGLFRSRFSLLRKWSIHFCFKECYNVYERAIYSALGGNLRQVDIYTSFLSSSATRTSVRVSDYNFALVTSGMECFQTQLQICMSSHSVFTLWPTRTIITGPPGRTVYNGLRNLL
jgi:hypothetical protein